MLLKTTIAAGILALGTLVGAAPANAGNFSFSVEIGEHGGRHYRGGEYFHQKLSPQQVRWILRDKGFRHIRFVDRDGPTYKARAENRRGKEVLVTVSSRTGAILDVRRLSWHG